MSFNALIFQVINVARKAFNSGKTQSLSFRLAQLKQMLKMMDENKERIVEALNRDMRKTRLEGNFCNNNDNWWFHSVTIELIADI